MNAPCSFTAPGFWRLSARLRGGHRAADSTKAISCGVGAPSVNFPVILKLAGRVSPLFLVNAFDFGVPFIRMMMLSHFLDLRELGFASLLTAVYSSFELITDINISRFVISAPREKYEEALQPLTRSLRREV